MPNGEGSTGLSSTAMTYLGAATAAVSFVAVNLPDGTPQWVRLCAGAILAAATVLGGKSHSGTGQKKDRS
jgi:hypothetical protein